MKSPILEKLRKLIAHEKSARSIGNLHEAEAFAAKIQDLLTAHKLGMDEVDYAEREATEPIDWERVSTADTGTVKTSLHWMQELANTIADVNGCQTVLAGGTRGCAFFFVGRTSDRELCKALYLYMVQLGEELCERCAHEDQGEQLFKFRNEKQLRYYATTPRWVHNAFKSWMKDWRAAYKEGFASAVNTRLRLNYARATKSAEFSAAMVHIKKDALAIKEFLKGETRKRYAPGAKGSNRDGFSRGKHTGNAVNLTPHNFAPKSSGRIMGALPAYGGWRDATS